MRTVIDLYARVLKQKEENLRVAKKRKATIPKGRVALVKRVSTPGDLRCERGGVGEGAEGGDRRGVERRWGGLGREEKSRRAASESPSHGIKR